MISHWDELEGVRRERGHISATWYDLTGERSVTLGARRVRVEPGMWSTPYHLEGSEEEIFYVLGGSGVSLQGVGGGDPQAFAVGPGDCLVHRASEHAHTLRAGPGGLDVIAFGERHYPVGSTYLPRAGVSWGLGTWTRTGAPEDHPWRREAEAGPPEVPPLAEKRPACLVHVDDVPADVREGATVTRSRRDLGRAAGSERTGLKLYEAPPGKLTVPPHCHSAEEEIFVVLAGEGMLELWGDAGMEETPVRAGHTVARPAGTGVAHAFRAGAEPLAVLAYGARVGDDVAYYPRSGKVYLRGVGLVTRLERLDYWDGED